MDMHSLQAPLEAIKHICTPEKAHAQSGKKASQINEAGNKRPNTGARKQVSNKVHFEKSCELCKKHWGVHTIHATKDCHGMRKTEREKQLLHCQEGR
jgi:hypothetical protein